jgi:hypothetical protein
VNGAPTYDPLAQAAARLFGTYRVPGAAPLDASGVYRVDTGSAAAAATAAPSTGSTAASTGSGASTTSASTTSGGATPQATSP